MLLHTITGLARHPVGEVTQNANRAVRSLLSAGCPGPCIALAGQSPIIAMFMQAKKHRAQAKYSILFYSKGGEGSEGPWSAQPP